MNELNDLTPEELTRRTEFFIDLLNNPPRESDQIQLDPNDERSPFAAKWSRPPGGIVIADSQNANAISLSRADVQGLFEWYNNLTWDEDEPKDF